MQIRGRTLLDRQADAAFAKETEKEWKREGYVKKLEEWEAVLNARRGGGGSGT
jgi:hypothetical protein